MRSILLLAATLLLSACGGDGDGALSQAIAEQHADYRIVDLETGSSTYRSTIDDLEVNPSYRDRLVVLRHLPQRSATIGATDGEPFADDDEHGTHPVSVAECYMAVFELTRAQWQRLNPGSAPWTVLGITDGDGRHPATGMSQVEAETALATWSDHHPAHLALPSATDWEAAARCAGGAFGFDPTQPSATSRHARVRESLTTESGSSSGTAPVGQRAANGWGLYDLHGNAAELTSTLDADAQALVHGGSWSDPVAATRATNTVGIPPQAGHPLVGLRVMLLP